MRCFYVLIHGELDWATSAKGGEKSRPAGFYCHRYVLASDEEAARNRAFVRVRRNLDQQVHWIEDGSARLRLRAEEVSIAPMHKLVKPDNRGHTFYKAE